MSNFWDFNVWSQYNVLVFLLGSLLVANILKKSIKLLRVSLIPTSVLAGAILLVVAGVYKLITNDVMFDTAFFGGKGTATLETLTYHTLALGFIASALKPTKSKITKERSGEIFNTGVTTVSTYLLQGVVGFGITMVAALVMNNFFPAAGLLLPFGYGQGTGQALNYGGIYENDFGFAGGKSFGLTIAALGFLSASIGGVIYLNLMRKKGKLISGAKEEGAIRSEEIQSDDEIPMQESIDKLTVQIALIAVAYMIAYLLMMFLGNLLPGMKSVIFGFNFLLGVLAATIVKAVMNFLKKKKIIKKEYVNGFLLTRVSNLFFDIMVVAGIAAIRLGVLQKYWGIMLILGVAGLVVTYIYNHFVAKVLFPKYQEEQFLAMYGMLTGTASTGIILLREVDGDFETPAADNLVYQNFPAIVFGFPIMLLATLAPVKPILTWTVFLGFFIVMNIILFRKQIFKRKNK
jgi:ESS family glutamate:Na+ symporter